MMRQKIKLQNQCLELVRGELVSLDPCRDLPFSSNDQMYILTEPNILTPAGLDAPSKCSHNVLRVMSYYCASVLVYDCLLIGLCFPHLTP